MFNLKLPDVATRLRGFQTNESGVSAVVFALTVPVIALGMAQAISYSRAIQYRAEVQDVVDAATLAGVNAVAGGATTSAAQTQVTTYLASNLPVGATTYGSYQIGGFGSLNNTVQGTVTYTGTVPTLFSAVTAAAAVPVNVTSTAAMQSQKIATVAQSNGATGWGYPVGPGVATPNGGCTGGDNCTYSGNQLVWGDPHMELVDQNNTSYYVTCSNPLGSWYNWFSDAGLQINVACEQIKEFSNADYISDVSIMLNGHQILIPHPTLPYFTDDAGDNITYFTGDIVIDGQKIPGKLGVNKYLNGSVVTSIGSLNPADNSSSNNFVYVGNDHTSIGVTFDYWGTAFIYLSLTNGGAQGVPGGFFGAALAGDYSPVSDAMRVSGPTATSSEYYWTWPAQRNAQNTTFSTAAHLTK